MTTIVRAQVAHTPRDPFLDDPALEAFADGAVAFEAALVAVFTLAREESIAEARVAGNVVWTSAVACGGPA